MSGRRGVRVMPSMAPFSQGMERLKDHLSDRQHANAYYLMLGNLVAAAAGLAFWFLLAAVLDLPPAMIGVGYGIFSIGTLVGVVAKGGLDTALVRSVPETGRSGALGLTLFAIGLGTAAAVLVSLLVMGAAVVVGAGFSFGVAGWSLVAVVAVLLVVTWLQDAYFVGEGDARFCFHRNVVLSAARVALPVPVVLLALPHPVALSWALALALSAVVAYLLFDRVPHREGGQVHRRVFVRRSLRNVTGTAAEFLPGFLLVPLILALRGPEEAGFFGIAWAGASLLFVASAASGRSALSQMVQGQGSLEEAPALRKGIRQHALLLLPAAVVGVVFAPQIMGLFGAAYAQEAAGAFRLLCASIVFVGPAYLYLACLRARDRPWVLTLFPFVMMAVLFTLAPPYAALYGVTGVAVAWFAANVPFGVWGAWRMWQITRGSGSIEAERGRPAAQREVGTDGPGGWVWSRRRSRARRQERLAEVDE